MSDVTTIREQGQTPAFPVADTVHPDGQIQFGYSGMSLRDYFAGQALASLRCGDWEKCENGAKFCYDYADAMLAERAKGQP